MDRPSRTAWRVAMHRAAHQVLDTPPVLADPYALRILPAADRAALLADPGRFERGPAAPALRAFLAVRSCVAEEALARAVAKDARQYVVLGAGLDTFALRNPHPDLRVFEVDHPGTQAWKRELLAHAELALPAGASLVPLDLDGGSLADSLAAAGFEAASPAFVSLLGVSMYVPADVLLRTLAWVGGRPAGSGIALDYALPRPRDPLGRAVFDTMAERVARAGEPWRTFLTPEAMAQRMWECGLSAVEDAGEAELGARWLTGRADGLRTGRLARMACAWVV